MKIRRIFIMRRSMEQLRGDSKELTEKGEEGLKSSQEIQTDITDLKTGLDDLPPDLDEPIASAIQEAKQAGREQATNDVNEIKEQINQDMAKAEDIKNKTDANISENNAAGSSLEGMKSNRYSGGIDRVISEIEANNAVGENIKTNQDAKYQEIYDGIDAVLNEI